MHKSRIYTCTETQFQDLVPLVNSWFDQTGFATQTLTTSDGKTLLQVSKRGGWRKAVGMSTALNVVFNYASTNLTVEIGAGRWMDKAAVGTVSLFVLWPLAVTAGIGAWKQLQMPDKVLDMVQKTLSDLEE